MREVLTRNPGETDKDFFTRAAAVIAEYRKMGNEAAADACFTDIFPELYPIIVEMVECESARNRLDDETENEYYDRVMLLIPKIFHKYNNPEFTDEKYNDEQFKIKTFLKTRTRHCIREAVAKRLGITTWDAKYLLEIRRARMSIAKRKKIDESKVSIDLIYEECNEKYDKSKILYLLEREKRVLSVDGVEENGGQFGEFDEIDASVYGYCLPDDCQKALDSVFDKMSRLEIYLLMKDCGFLGDDIMEMEMCEFVTTPEFQEFFMEDSSIRSRKDPVKTAYNKKQKLQKMLITLDGKIIVGDLKGCLGWYLWRKIDLYR